MECTAGYSSASGHIRLSFLKLERDKLSVKEFKQPGKSSAFNSMFASKQTNPIFRTRPIILGDFRRLFVNYGNYSLILNIKYNIFVSYFRMPNK